MIHKRTITAVWATMVMLTLPAMAEVAVIAHPSCTLTSVSNDDIKGLYLGKVRNLGGNKITPVDQSKNSRVSDHFYSSVVGKSSGQIRAYWSKLVYSGKGRPPIQLDGDTDVLLAVASDPELIGYVDASLVDSSVKVLLTIQ